MNEYLRKLVEKAEALQWDQDAPPVVRDQENSVVADAFDNLAWQMLYDAVPTLRKSIKNVQEEHDYVAPAYEDLFNLLHQGNPMLRDVETIKQGYDANHEIFSHMQGTDEFQQLRSQTVFDEWNTAFAMLSMEDHMKAEFERIKDAREARAEAAAADAAAQNALGQAISNAQQPGADPATAGAALTQASQAAQAAQQQLQQAQAALDSAAAQGGEAMAQAAQAAKESLDEENSTASGFGVDPGVLKRMPWEERRALTARLDNDKMKKLAALCGVFRRHGDAERRRKIKHAPSVVVDVELGNDMAKLIPEEWNRLAIPELEDLFWMNFAQRGLMQWLTEGTEKVGQGPIIVVCDESASMGAAVGKTGATREMWSKALSMALADAAKRGKRDFIYIGFASAGQQWVKHFPNGNLGIEDVIDFASHFFGGGTSYEPPLNMANEIVSQYGKDGKPKPDIVFITDDDCSVSQRFIDSWQAVKADLDMTCYGIQIGVTRTSNAMHLLCDKTILLTNLNADPEGMTELFRTI